MAEVVKVEEVNGGTPTYHDLTGYTARFCSSPDWNPQTNYPCRIPTSGTKRSFTKIFVLNISGTGWSRVSDITMHCEGTFEQDWALGTNGMVIIGHKDTGDSGLPIATDYEEPSGEVGNSGNPLEDMAFFENEAVPYLNFDECTADTPLSIDSGPYMAPFRSMGACLQLIVGMGATHGDKTAKAVIWSYNIY